MNFKEAVFYSKENHSLMENDGIQLVGIAYLPNDKYDKFQIFTVDYNLECTQEEESDHFNVSWNGNPEWYGDLPTLIREAPDIAISLSYQPLKVECFIDFETWYTLKLIFPELPDQESLEFISDYEFEKRAAVLVENFNSHNQ